VPESRDSSAPRYLDWRGVVTLALALFLILFGLNRANDEGWTSPLIVACFAAGAAGLPLFVLVERRVKFPLVDLTLFKSWPFVTACISAGLFSAAVFGSQPYTSLFMQNYLGFSALEGGLAFIPATALVALLMPVSGILGQRLGHRIRLIIIAGSLSVGLSFLYLLQIDVDSRYMDGLLPAFVLRGLGIGLVMSATSFAVVSSMPVQKSGLASGTLTMARNIGTSVGVAVFGAVFLQSIDANLPGQLAAAGITGAEADAAVARAEHFVPSAAGPEREASRETIVDGFLVISGTGLAICALAAVSAAMIRPKRAVAGASTASPVAAGIPPEPAMADGGS
jgi:MFS family permease